jgi:hypothetical protein
MRVNRRAGWHVPEKLYKNTVHRSLQEEHMELQSARQIIDTLAQGIHPVTGEVMPDNSPYNAPPVIRALFAVSQALEGAKPARQRKPQPPNAGKPWAAEDDVRLQQGFGQGLGIAQLAQELGRTRWAVESRLVKLGRLAGKGDVPFTSGAAQ